MTISTVGFDNADITEAGFSRLMRAVGELANKHGVTSGFAASPGAGTRQVSVSAGTAMAPGALVTSDATATVTLDANASSSERTDYVVLEVDWSANSSTLKAVTGTSVTPPTLTQTEGTVWQIPLARVSVPAGYASTFASSHITVCKPLPRVPRIFRGTIVAGSVTGGTATLSTLTISDPGWPYLLDISVGVRMQSNPSARARLAVTDAAGATVAQVVSPLLADIGPLRVDNVGPNAYGGPTTLTLTIVRSSGTGAVASNESNTNVFVVRQIPA